MKYRAITTAILLLNIFFLSCRDKKTFTVSGTIKNASAIKTIYLLETDGAQLKVVDSSALNAGGEFKFTRKAAYASFFKLRTGTTMFDVVAKNGDDIQLTTDLADPKHDYTIKGSDESEKVKEFEKISKFYGDKNNKLVAEFEQRSQNAGAKQDSLLKIYTPVFQNNLSEYSNRTLKFISDNKQSLAAFYAASSLDPVKYEPQLIAYADDIKDVFKDNPVVQQFVSAMEKAKPLSVGHSAPDFTINTADGTPVKLSAYRGKYVMIDFWASWCVPCRQENPNVLKQYIRFKPKGFNILSISLDKDKDAWRTAIKDDKLAWTQASDLKSFEGQAELLYHIEAIPSDFIIDPQGKIVAKNIRGADLQAFLTKTFK